MDLCKYYDGDLKYPNITNHSHEKEIAKTKPDWAFEYVSEHGKDEELEPIIAKDAKYSYYYALDILRRKRFELGELAISKNPMYSFQYAQDVLNGEFKLGEKIISTNAHYSY